MRYFTVFCLLFCCILADSDFSFSCSSGPDFGFSNSPKFLKKDLLIQTITIGVLILAYCCYANKSFFINALRKQPQITQKQRVILASIYVSNSCPEKAKFDTCRKRHLLTFVYGKENFQTQVCNICGRRYSMIEGSWRCLQCDFDVCRSCKSIVPSQSLKYKSCMNKHPLVLSNYNGVSADRPYFDGYYICNLCLHKNPCDEGRYFCAYCLINVCKDCQKT